MAEIKSDEYSSTIKDGLLCDQRCAGQDQRAEERESRQLQSGRGAAAGRDRVVRRFDCREFRERQDRRRGLLLAGCASREKFGSGTLHVEFRVPYLPEAVGQERGNSGVFVQGRYEIQILDSFGEEASDKGCGTIFGQGARSEHELSAVCLADVRHRADASRNTRTARKSKAPKRWSRSGTTAGRSIAARSCWRPRRAPVAAGPDPGPIVFEDKGSAVRFQNIWFKPAGKVEVKK